MDNELKPREHVCPRTITIENSYWEFAKQLGQGNASKGIRRALYEASVNNSGKITRKDSSREINELQLHGLTPTLN
jgi:hypothetical protein